MQQNELSKMIAQGEDGKLQFKENIHNVDALAAEMVAFSNAKGGRILIGVSDRGKAVGIATAASSLPLSQEHKLTL